MSRIKFDMPAIFPFKTSIPVRITDLNYGGHVGNDQILSMIHEARVQYLLHLGFEEMNLAGVGLIMRNVEIEFKSELFYGDIIQASVAAGDFSRIGFELYYQFEKEKEKKKTLLVLATTGMICYNYTTKKIVSLPETARQKMTGI
ncbi:MAG: acyl-CoA thioesterase [Chitinophagales bacterium]